MLFPISGSYEESCSKNSRTGFLFVWMCASVSLDEVGVLGHMDKYCTSKETSKLFLKVVVLFLIAVFEGSRCSMLSPALLSSIFFVLVFLVEV